MRPIHVPALLAAIIPSILSQSTGQAIIPSTLPACAQSCANLLQAQTACAAPPNPPPGGTYGIQCFCGFGPLLILKADAPQQLCAACSPSDNAAIQSWYKGACGVPGGSGQNGQSITATTPTSTPSTSASTPTGQGATASGNPANAPNVTQGNWISTHWKWIVMLIILALGFTALVVGGVYLRRYSHRRRDARDFGVAGSRQDLETWGPGQSAHDFGATGVANNQSANEKGKETEVVQNQGVPEGRRNSRRLKKGWLPGRAAK